MAYGKLVGTDTIGATPCSGSTHRLTKFVASTSGWVDEFRVYSLSTGQVRVNFYEANEFGEPGDLVWAQDTNQAVTGSQWNAISVPDVPVVAGTTYWLGANGNAGGRISFSSDISVTRLKAATFATFTAPDPAGIGFSDANDEQGAFSLYGLPNPVITNIDGDDTFFDHDTGLVMPGTDFGASQGTGKVELANNSDYDSATVITEQTIGSWADTSITFSVKAGALADGTVYAFVTTDAGQRNLVGHSATLVIEVSQGTAGGEGLPVPNGFWPTNGVHANAGVWRGITKHGIRTEFGVADSKMINTVPGIDNLDTLIDFPAASAVAPTFRYKLGDADGTNVDAWDYGNDLPFQAGTAPDYNDGSPLWQSSNDDSAKFNDGGHYQDSSIFTGFDYSDDFWIEGFVSVNNIGNSEYILASRGSGTNGFQIYVNPAISGKLTYYMRDNALAERFINSNTGIQGVIYFSLAYDASEDSVYSSHFCVNSDCINKNLYGLGAVTQGALTIGADAAGDFDYNDSIFYLAAYSGTLWSGGAANETESNALHKKRLYQMAGVYPSLSSDDTVSFDRDYSAYLRAPSDIASATDSTKRLWYMGNWWPRVESRVDSAGNESVGYLSERETDNESDQWQVDDWTLLDGTDTETADDLLAPDRTQTMTTLIPSTTSGLHGWNKSITLTAASYVVSAFGYEVNSKWLRLEDNTVANCYAIFDLSNGTIYETGAGCTSHISAEDYECDGNNKGYRCDITLTGTAAAHDIRVKLQGGTTTPSDTFAGDGVSKYIGVWGAQVEQSDKVTSLIKTAGATATRLGDVIYYVGDQNIGGANAGSGEAQFTMHSSDTNNLTDRGLLAIVDSSDAANNHVKVELDDTDVCIGYTESISGNAGLTTSGVDVTDNDRHKAIMRWRDDDTRIVVDNIAGSHDTDCKGPTGLNRIYVGCDETGANQPNSNISNLTFSSAGINPTASLQTTETSGSIAVTFRGQSGFSFDVDWGDGSSESIALLGTGTPVITIHAYDSTPGTKTITLSGDAITKMTYIRANGNADFVNSVADLAQLDRVTTYIFDTASYTTGLKELLEGHPSADTLTANGSSFEWVSFTPESILTTVTLQSNGWSSAEVDQCLIDFDNGGGTGGTLNVAGTNAVRTTASDAALASLVGNGWTVTVNE